MRSRVSLGATTIQSTPDPAGRDPRTLIAERPMSSFQVLIIAVLFCLNALDGFDVLAIAFAAPGITKDWSLSPQTIGFIISVGLFANAAGALFVAPLADRIGRRPMILLSLAAMTSGMVLCAIADNTGLLSAGRLVTGVGVGAHPLHQRARIRILQPQVPRFRRHRHGYRLPGRRARWWTSLRSAAATL